MNSGPLVATLLLSVLQLIVLLVFPPVAVRNWRAGGGRHLAFTAAGTLALILAAGLALASESFGNRLSATDGYIHIATRILTLFIITLGLPVLAVTAVVRLIPRQRSTILDYCIALAAGVIAWVATGLLSVYLAPLLTSTAP